MAPSTSKSSLLWVAPRWPFPPDDGAKVAMERLIRPLSQAGLRVELMSIVPAWESTLTPSPLALGSSRIERRGGSSRLGTRLSSALASVLIGGQPYSVRSFSNSALRARVRSWLGQFPDETPIVIDGLHVAAALPAETAKRWIYRAHNVEWRILEDFASLLRGPKKIFLSHQAKALRDFETHVIEMARMSFAVSRSDADELTKLSSRAKIDVLPIGADFSAEPEYSRPRTSGVTRLLFVGRLDWEPNRDGLVWFLREVWPHLTPAAFELEIVGSGDGSYLEPWRGIPGITLCGRVDSVQAHYAAADLCLVPLRWASGTRVKIIEAIQLGRAVLSTQAGALGLELPADVLEIAETPQEWISRLNEGTAQKWENLARRAWPAAAAAYGEKVIAMKLKEFL